MRAIIIKEAKRQLLRLGLRKFTVEYLASELGISKKTIYKHFSSKDEIIGVVVDYVMAEEKTYTEQVLEMMVSPISKMEALMFFYAGAGIPDWVIDELKRYYPTEYQKREEIQLMKSNNLKQLFAEGIETGEIRRDIKSGMLNLMIRQTFEAILDGDFLESQDLTLNQAIEQMKKIVLYGIVVRTKEERES